MEENISNSENYSISVQNILFLLKKNIILVIIVTLCATVVGGVYSIFFKDTTYTSSATAMVVVPSSNSTSEEIFDYSYSLNLMKTIEEFIKSKAVAKRVSEKLSDKYDMEISHNYISNSIEISVTQYSLIITINSSTTISNELAIDLANEVIDSTIYIINNELETNDGIKPLANKLVIVDEAISSTASKGALVVVVIAFIIGFIISLVIILCKYFLNDTFTSKDDFERVTGLNVLSLLPSQVSTWRRENEK